MRYLIYDVFTDTPFEGNQLAVYPEPPRDIPENRMLRIAAEMNYSERTFVLPPPGSGDVKMRIFTPGKELPLAGHPTIGTTFALADEGVIARGRDQFVFELGVGPIPVSLQWGETGLTFAWMTQLLPSFGARIEDRTAFAAAVGLEQGDLLDRPVERASTASAVRLASATTHERLDLGIDPHLRLSIGEGDAIVEAQRRQRRQPEEQHRDFAQERLLGVDEHGAACWSVR
mgnify:CR=1 FL=1